MNKYNKCASCNKYNILNSKNYKTCYKCYLLSKDKYSKYAFIDNDEVDLICSIKETIDNMYDYKNDKAIDLVNSLKDTVNNKGKQIFIKDNVLDTLY